VRRRHLLALGASAAAVPAWAQQARPEARIVSVGSSVTEIVYALGAEKQLVGVDTTSLYPDAARGLPQVGYMRALSAEGVLSLKPSLVIATTAAGPASTLDQLKATGVEVLVLPDEYDYESVIAKIDAIGTVLGKPDAALAMIAEGRAAMADLAAKIGGAAAKPRVLFLLSMGSGAPQAAGQHTAADGIIRLAGGVNAVEGYAGYRTLTPEAVIASRAEFVLVTRQTVETMGGVEAILKQPALSQTPAGKAGRVLQFDTLLLLGFGPRTPQAAAQLAMALHPDLAHAR
jgi:iron complex transport system substrate-binding protein